jgi:hypothetical protein
MRRQGRATERRITLLVARSSRVLGDLTSTRPRVRRCLCTRDRRGPFRCAVKSQPIALGGPGWNACKWHTHPENILPSEKEEMSFYHAAEKRHARGFTEAVDWAFLFANNGQVVTHSPGT